MREEMVVAIGEERGAEDPSGSREKRGALSGFRSCFDVER
jgi:hypothetical protein